MHDRISVSEVSSWRWTLDDDLAFYDRAGIDRIGVAFRKLEAEGDPVAAAQRVTDAGVHVTNLLAPGPFQLDRPEAWPEHHQRMGAILDTALALRPDVLVLTTGPAGQLSWERAADAFEQVMGPAIAETSRESLAVAIEHTHSLRTDVGFVHTLRDAIELAWRVGTGVCLEVNACWAERNLLGTIGAGIDAITLVQLSDYVIGTHTTPDRVVPGDGDIPLGRIVGALLDAGYDGSFDIEVIGPRIEDEGYEAAITRSVAAVEELIGGSGQPDTQPVDAQPVDAQPVDAQPVDTSGDNSASDAT